MDASAAAVGVAPDEATAVHDPLAARLRLVDAAVDALTRALGDRGATYRGHVQRWRGALDPATDKLDAFPTGLKKAAQRLPASPPELREAHHTFVRAIEDARHPGAARGAVDAPAGAVGGRDAEAVASDDPIVTRQRLVDAAVQALTLALGDQGATYRAHVQRWHRALDPAAPKLAPFPQGMWNAANRLPASPPALRQARDAFVRAINLARPFVVHRQRAQPVRPSHGQALNAEVRPWGPCAPPNRLWPAWSQCFPRFRHAPPSPLTPSLNPSAACPSFARRRLLLPRCPLVRPTPLGSFRRSPRGPAPRRVAC